MLLKTFGVHGVVLMKLFLSASLFYAHVHLYQSITPQHHRSEPSIVTLALIHKDIKSTGVPAVSCYFPVKSTLSAQKGTFAKLEEVPGMVKNLFVQNA